MTRRGRFVTVDLADLEAMVRRAAYLDDCRARGLAPRTIDTAGQRLRALLRADRGDGGELGRLPPSLAHPFSRRRSPGLGWSVAIARGPVGT